MSPPKNERAVEEQGEEDAYMLGRDYLASARLALIQLLIHTQFGFLLHPSITSSLPQGTKTENLTIADVGTGTGIYLGELAREFPASTKLDGFDISSRQYPPEGWYGPNATLDKLDVFKPLPESLKGKYDIVQLRFFMTIAKDENVDVVVENLTRMLKPGGYLQWVERDWLSKFSETATSAENANKQVAAYMKKFFPNVDWINHLPCHFQTAGLEVVGYEHQPPLPVYRKPWNEDNLIGTAAFGENIKDEMERKWFQDVHARAATECAGGWYVDWEIIICAGRKGDSGS